MTENYKMYFAHSDAAAATMNKIQFSKTAFVTVSSVSEVNSFEFYFGGNFKNEYLWQHAEQLCYHAM